MKLSLNRDWYEKNIDMEMHEVSAGRASNPLQPASEPSMDDLITRLRNYEQCTDSDVDKAADELERLRAGDAELRRGLQLAAEYIVTLRQITYAARQDVVDTAWSVVNARGSAWYAFLAKNDMEA